MTSGNYSISFPPIPGSTNGEITSVLTDGIEYALGGFNPSICFPLCEV